jgi:FG-GAP-like repeat/Thrombospondin type 3 repeat
MQKKIEMRRLALSIAMAMACSPAAFAVTGQFTNTTGQLFGGNLAYDSQLVDLDHDGDRDALVTSQTSGVELYRNNGAGTFSSMAMLLHFQSNSQAAGSVTSDFDGDGDTDFFTAYGHVSGTGNRQSILWLNNGTGSFTKSTQVIGNAEAFSLEKGDFDGDGDMDVVVNYHSEVSASAPTATDTLWLNNGAGVFTPQAMPEANVAVRGYYEAGDIDSDGDLDLLFVTASGNVGPNTPQTHSVYKNDGNGNFTLHSTFANVGAGVELGDVDADGDLDVVLSRRLPGGSPVMLNDGNGYFSAAAHGGFNSAGSYSWGGSDIALLDSDMDGDLDAFITTDTIYPLWINDGTGYYTNSTQALAHLSGRPPRSVGFGDVDGDQDPDLICNYRGGNKIWFNAGLPAPDTDSDGIVDAVDNCPTVANSVQFNVDGDAQGDACDSDDDNDTIADSSDLCPLNVSNNLDYDSDGVGDQCDADADGDSLPWASGFDSTFAATTAIAAGDGWTAAPVLSSHVYFNDADSMRIPQALVIDAQNLQHAIFSGEAGAARNRLSFYYASSNANGTWSHEIIRTFTRDELGASSFAGAANGAAMAIDPVSGNLHAILTYQSGIHAITGKPLTTSVYAVSTNGVWTTSDLPMLNNATYDSVDIAVDANSLVHVTFENAHRGYYLSRSGSTWAATKQFSNEVFNLDMALGSDNSVRVAYAIDGGGKGVKTVVLNPQITNPTPVTVFNRVTAPHPSPAFNAAGYYAQIQLDSANNPHILYTNDSGVLGYSSSNAGVWSHEVLPVDFNTTPMYSFVLDAAEHPQIAFNKGFAGETIHRQLSLLSYNGSWTEQTVYNLAATWNVKVARDSSGQASMLFGKGDTSVVGAGWVGTVLRPYMAGWDADWVGAVSAKLGTASTPTEQRYALVTDAGTNSEVFNQQYYLTFNSSGVADSRYPEDLDITVNEFICTSGSCGSSVEQRGDARAVSAKSNFDTSGSAAALGDFNNDGLTDFIALGQDVNGQIVVEFQKKVSAKNAFASRIAPQAFPLNASTVDSFVGTLSNYVDAAAADFNDDGNLDFVVTDAGNSTLRVYVGNGDGTFQAATLVSLGISPAGVDAADLNGDDQADLVVASSGTAGSVAVLLGNGLGGFAQTIVNLTVSGSSIAGVTLGDFDGDQDADMVITNLGAGVTFFQGLGNGLFNTNPIVSLATELPAVSAEYRAVDNDYLNSDAHMDLLMTNPSTQSTYVLVGQGNGSFVIQNQQFAHYIDWQNNFCAASLDRLSGAYSACLQDPTKVEFLPWLKWGDATPKGIATFPYFDLGTWL